MRDICFRFGFLSSLSVRPKSSSLYCALKCNIRASICMRPSNILQPSQTVIHTRFIAFELICTLLIHWLITFFYPFLHLIQVAIHRKPALTEFCIREGRILTNDCTHDLFQRFCCAFNYPVGIMIEVKESVLCDVSRVCFCRRANPQLMNRLAHSFKRFN